VKPQGDVGETARRSCPKLELPDIGMSDAGCGGSPGRHPAHQSVRVIDVGFSRGVAGPLTRQGLFDCRMREPATAGTTPESITHTCLLAPAPGLLQRARWVDRQLPQRPPVQSRHRRGHQPRRAAHLEYAHQRALWLGCDAGFGRVVGLGQRLLHRCQCNKSASDLIVRPITSRGSLFRHLGRLYRPM
jgi:hypothetical protein